MVGQTLTERDAKLERGRARFEAGALPGIPDPDCPLCYGRGGPLHKLAPKGAKLFEGCLCYEGRDSKGYQSQLTRSAPDYTADALPIRRSGKPVTYTIAKVGTCPIHPSECLIGCRQCGKRKPYDFERRGSEEVEKDLFMTGKVFGFAECGRAFGLRTQCLLALQEGRLNRSELSKWDRQHRPQEALLRAAARPVGFYPTVRPAPRHSRPEHRPTDQTDRGRKARIFRGATPGEPEIPSHLTTVR